MNLSHMECLQALRRDKTVSDYPTYQDILERENAQYRAVIAEQKEAIDQLRSTPADKREDLRCVISDLCDQAREQSALIECLYLALHTGWTVGAREFDARQLADEAFQQYEQWKGAK